MDAKEFCEIKDYKLGVKWSENYIELAKAMEEYHQMKLLELGITPKPKELTCQD